MKNKKTKGIYIQDNNGLWRIDAKIKINNQYRHITSKGYSTLKEAKEDFESVKMRFIDKHTKKATDFVFNDLISEYSKYRAISVRDSTIDIDNSLFNNYFYPYFNKVSIDRVFKQSTFNKWYLDILNNQKVSNARKDKVRTRMKDLVNYAYLHHYITADIKQDCDCCLTPIKYSKKAKCERVIWNNDERDRFLSLYPLNSDKYVMYRFFYLLGLRIGEFLALTPKSFNYENQTISIFQQARFVRGRTMEITDTLKNETSYRIIKIDNESATILDNYIKQHNLKENDILFTATNNHKRPMGRTTFSHNLRKDCIKAKVRVINPHAIRHMIAVKLASVSTTTAEIEQASKRMGHTPSVFMDIYANHSTSDIEEKLNKTLFA